MQFFRFQSSYLAIASHLSSEKITLTVDYLDYRPENCIDDNLKVLCFPCHARYDVSQMALKRSLKKERKGQLSLF